MLAAALFLLPVVAVAGSAPFFNISPQPDSITLSYKLPDPHQEFWHSVRDALRAGDSVIVRHRVEVFHHRPWLWNKRIARVTAAVQVNYNLFEKRFTVGKGNTPERARTYFDEQTAEEVVLSMQHLPLKLDAPMQSGETYRVVIEMQLLGQPQDRSWHRFLPIEGLFRPQLIQEVEYVEP